MSPSHRALAALLAVLLSISAVGGLGTVVFGFETMVRGVLGLDAGDASAGLDFPCQGNGCACSDRGYCGDDCCCQPVVIETGCGHCAADPEPAPEPRPEPTPAEFVLRARGCGGQEPVITPVPQALLAWLSLPSPWILSPRLSAPESLHAERLDSRERRAPDKVPIEPTSIHETV